MVTQHIVVHLGVVLRVWSTANTFQAACGGLGTWLAVVDQESGFLWSTSNQAAHGGLGMWLPMVDGHEETSYRKTWP